jgi:tetratricopeptide (TPR) repeat protein
MQYENYSEAVEKFKKVDSDLPREGNMLLSYGKALLMAGNAKQAVEVLERAAKITADPFLYSNLGEGYRMLKQYSMAEQAYQQASNMVPNRLYPKYLLAKMYVERGDTLMAQGVAKAILNTKEKIESPATREMKEDMRKIINP